MQATEISSLETPNFLRRRRSPRSAERFVPPHDPQDWGGDPSALAMATAMESLAALGNRVERLPVSRRSAVGVEPDVEFGVHGVFCSGLWLRVRATPTLTDRSRPQKAG